MITYYQKGSDRLIQPPILLKKMANDNASTKQSHENVHGHNGGMIWS